MKYLLIQFLLLVSSVLILYYLFLQNSFLPQDDLGMIIWQNYILFLVLFTISIEAVFAISIFSFQKVFLTPKSNWPGIYTSLKWGMVIAITLMLILTLNILHLITLLWGAAIGLIIITATFLLK
jgi:hypothetical protein